jgi:hypothetical protein
LKRLIYILFLHSSFYSYSQTKPAIVVANIPSSVPSGQPFSVFFEVRTSDIFLGDLIGELVLPNSWNILADKMLYTSENALTRKYYYTIATPTQVAVGSYPIDFHIESGHKLIDSATVYIDIEEVKKLDTIALTLSNYNPSARDSKVDSMVQKTEPIPADTKAEESRIDYLINNSGHKSTPTPSDNSKGTDITISNIPNSIRPGQHFSLFFKLNTKESVGPSVKSKLILPDKWKILAERTIYTSEDSLSKKYLFTISTPSQAASGNYPFEFHIESGDTTLDYTTGNINIEEIRKLDVTTLRQPEYVKEGDELKVEYLIQNSGNKSEFVKLETSRGVVENAVDSLEIKSNSSVKVVVKQTIPSTTSSNWEASSDLKVSVSNQIAPIFKTITVHVYSTKIKKNDPYLRFPINIGGDYLNYTTGNQTASAYQYFAEGKGYLDFANKHYLDFTIRGPNQSASPALGNYDQHSLIYSYLTRTIVTAGDFVLKLNNLMEFGRFGRGLKIEQSLGNANFSAFYQQARFSPNQKDAFGAVYKLNLKNDSYLSLNFESKNLNYYNTRFKSNLLGVSSFIRRKWGTNETEIDLGEAKSKMDVAFYNKWLFKYKKLNTNSEIIYAGRNFYGFYTNSILLANGINFYLTKKLNIGINSNISRINPSLDTRVYAISPYSTTNMAFLSYQPNIRNMFFINFTKLEREDRQQPSTFHYKEDAGNFIYNLYAKKMSLSAHARYGFAQNLLAIDSTAKKMSTAYILQPSVALFPWCWIGGYFEYQHTSKFSTTNTPQNLYYFGGNIKLNYSKNISLNFMYRNNYAPDEFFEKRSFMDGSLVFDFKKHQLNLNAGRVFVPNIVNNDQNSLFFSAMYIYKINVPIKKDKNLGQLKGQIQSLSEGINKEGILMQLGQYKVMTDSSGSFTFSNLMPNKYFVTMVPNPNLIGVVSTLKAPFTVDIESNTTKTLTIPLVKTGSVIGNINFEKNEKDSTSIPPSVYHTIGVVYVKLFNEKESNITQMNDKNEFTFKEIKPGIWKLKLIIPGKSEQYEILNQEQEVKVESSQVRNHTFLIKAIERKIKFSGKNFNIKTEKK